jgi:hypothetical protein
VAEQVTDIYRVMFHDLTSPKFQAQNSFEGLLLLLFVKLVHEEFFDKYERLPSWH